MEIITVTPSDNKLWEEVWRLYTDSFPEYERRRISSHSRACDDKYFHTKICIENGNLLALLFYWKKDGMIYVEHIAVNPLLRGQNIGSRTLQQLMSNNPDHRFILEIDPPVDEVSKRRLKFYTNLGFHLNDFFYIHPSYSKNGYGHELKIMSYDSPLTQEEYAQFIDLMNGTVMCYID